MVSSTLTESNSDDLLFVHHVARLLGVPCRTVRHWAATGRLPAIRVGGRVWKFRRGDVVAFAQRRDDTAYCAAAGGRGTVITRTVN
jgi:excisionase family DNA binding protein